MQVVSPSRPVVAHMADCTVTYKPFCRYIVSDYEAMYLTEYTRNTEWTKSSFNPYERRYGGQDLNGKKVCIYRHTAYGDQLMISSVPYYLKTLYPDAIVHLYCDPGIVDMWDGNSYVGGGALPLPIPFDVARSYDYHIFYEGMLENNGEHDQSCCYDDFFGMIGLNDVPAQFKRPHLTVRPEDGNSIKALDLDLNGKYLVYHLSPANKNRCYPPKKGMEFINLFLKKYPDWRVFIVGKGDKVEWKNEYKTLRPNYLSVVNLVDKTKSFRQLIPIIQRASMVVCPDSSVLHLAACFPEVPIVSLWGLFDPNDRAEYYSNNYPITKFEACPYAPCHNHEFSLPRHKCTKSVGWKDGQEYCQAMNAIDPEDIMNKIKEIL